MKTKTKAYLQITFSTIIGIMALFPIGDSIIRGVRVEIHILGFVSLVFYLCAVFLRKRTFAG